MYTHTLNFALGEDIEALRDMVRRFAQDGSRRSPPRSTAPTNSRAHCGRARRARPARHHRRSDHGGSGMGYLAHVVAVEEIRRASASVGLSYGAHSNLCVNQINRWGNAAQKAHICRSCAPARRSARWPCRNPAPAPTSSRCGSRPKAERPLRAQRHQDVDHQRPRCRHAGRLCQDRSGRAARAASPPSSSRRACKGFSVAQKLDKLGMRGSNTGELVFENVEVPFENVLHEEGRGVEC